MSGPGKVEEGGCVTGLFREIWVVDFEYRAAPGEHPWPVCMVAEEIKEVSNCRRSRPHDRPKYYLPPIGLDSLETANLQLGLCRWHPDRERFCEGAVAGRALLHRQDGTAVVGVDDRDVEPRPVLEQP
jgi:hypothetical protein